jgi:ribosomal-protein-alanine N-acetyltransferase
METPRLTIRKATPEDASVLVALHAGSFGAACWSLSQLASSLALETTLALVVEDDAPRGFILCQLVAGEAEILTFCVAPLARRQGAGTLLVAEAIRTAREQKVTQMFLDVAADNAAALSLYQKSGFQISGTRVAYYRRGEKKVDAYLMTLPL